VALLIWLLISVGFPAIFYILEIAEQKQTASMYAEGFAEKFKDLVLDAPSLWKYQNHKYQEVLSNALQYNEVKSIRVLDETEKSIADYEYQAEQADTWWNRNTSLGSAPIIFNNRQIATIEVGLSQVGI
jgi:hypothetical protein